MAESTASVDAGRIWRDIEALAERTEPQRPFTRRSFSPEFDRGREYLAGEMRAAGLDVRVDSAGNLIGRLEGEDPSLPAIAMGSHSDTVQGGGRFDGIAGVVAALEVARVVAGSGGLRHPLEVIDCLAEEPSDFGISCIGSRAMTGMLDAASLDLVEKGGSRTLREAIAAIGGDPDRLDDSRRDDLAAFLELHIEQGPVLESERIDIGIVTSIVGIRRAEIAFTGEAAHAGTAPMHLRRDAAYAGALAIAAIREHAEMFAKRDGAYFVATVGIVDVRPGGSNVVAGYCRLVVDVRSSDREMTDAFLATLEAETLQIATCARVDRTGFEVMSDSPPSDCDETLRDHIREAARTEGLTSIAQASGAGHDAAFLTRICPSAMIFIPCWRGMSHHPDEATEPSQLAAGTQVMLETVRRIDRDLGAAA